MTDLIKANYDEAVEFLNLFRQLSKEDKRCALYMILGASFIAKTNG